MKGYHDYQRCIEACLRCAAICNHCATSCTEESDVNKMALCIRLDMQCAAICYATAQLLSLGNSRAKELTKLCAAICSECAEECGRYKDMNHCVECAEACKRCAEECFKIAA